MAANMPVNSAVPPVTIVRMAPGDQSLTCDFSVSDSARGAAVFANIRLLTSGEWARYRCSGDRIVISPLLNGVDYEIRITAETPEGRVFGRSADRLFRCGFVPGTVVAYLHPEDETFLSSGNATCSPSICAAPDGALLVSHDIYRSKGGQNLTHVYRSEDGGRTWRFASALSPCFWGSLFVHRDRVYLLATATEYGALLLYESSDCGTSWRGPVQLLAGGSSEDGGPHKAPVPVVEHAGRLWAGVEFGSWRLRMHCPGAVSADVDADLMTPEAWSCTGFLPYDPALVPDVRGYPIGGTLEGNLVVAPDGGLVDLLRYQTATCVPNYGKAYMTAVDAGHPDRPMRFLRTVEFPGNLSKFHILRSPSDGRYYALSNRVTTKTLNQRNILTLSASDDLVNWEVRRDILNYADNCFPEEEDKVGFQYPSFIFDGDDILAVSRTAVNGAENFHNANFITFHRIRNYAR